MKKDLKAFDFKAFSPPGSPNWHLACPPGSELPACRSAAPTFNVPLARLRSAFFDVAAAKRRVALIADAGDERRYRFVQKTAVFKFVDEITVEFVELGPEASSLFILSRSRRGWWDLGVNRRRVRRWLKSLERQLAG